MTTIRLTFQCLRSSGASADRRKLFRFFSDGGALPRRRYAGWNFTGDEGARVA